MATVILNASIKCDYLCECELYQKYIFRKQKSGDGGVRGASFQKTLISAEWFHSKSCFPDFSTAVVLSTFAFYFDHFSFVSARKSWEIWDADKITMLRMMLIEDLDED